MTQHDFFQAERSTVETSRAPITTAPLNRPVNQETMKSPPSPPFPISYRGTAGSPIGHHFAQRLAELFQSQLTCLPADLKDLPTKFIENKGLLIYEEPVQSWLKTWFCGLQTCRMVSHCPISILVARQPRWPIRQLLLITRGQLQDYMAATWVGQLAARVQATVTVLAVQPPLSTANSQALYGDGLSTWLRSDTALGQQLRYLVNVLGTATGCLGLQFRGGSSGRQIRKAISSETEPDLLVIASDPVEWWERRILGDLVTPLLRWADRPVLVAKSSFD